MKNRNKGMSLVELIIIIAIMGVVGGYLIYNSSVIFGYSARECHKKIVSSISNTKIDILSKAKKTGDSYLEITQDTSGFVYVQEVLNGEALEKKQLCKRKLLLEIKDKGGVDLASASSLPQSYKLYFDRNSGAMLEPATYNPAGDPLTFKTSTIKTIDVSIGNHTYNIEFHPKTGKISYR